MEEPLKILIVDENTFDAHVGEECHDIKEVMAVPTKRAIQTYSLFFRGIIRSVFREKSGSIEVAIDTGSELYNTMFEELQQTMKSEEGIDFTIRRN